MVKNNIDENVKISDLSRVDLEKRIKELESLTENLRLNSDRHRKVNGTLRKQIAELECTFNEVTFNGACKMKAQLIADTLVKKQSDYGPDNIKVFGQQGVVIRLSDKINRLVNLTKGDSIASNETIEDTFLDIAGYGIIGMMLQDKSFDLPLDRDEWKKGSGHA